MSIVRIAYNRKNYAFNFIGKKAEKVSTGAERLNLCWNKNEVSYL